MKTKVLILDPNKALAEMWHSYLQQHAVDAFVFISGETDVTLLRSWGAPHVILSGIEPVNGHIVTAQDLCFQMYGDKEELNPPLIQLHASFLNTEQQQSIQKSVFMLIKKPVSFLLLLDAVRKAAFEYFFSYYQDNHSAAMTAELKGDALIGIMQYIDATKKSGMILVKARERRAYVSFNQGIVVNAQYAGFSGAKAIYEIFTWQRGQSSFFEADISEEPSGLIPEINALILEGKRQTDEVKQAESTLDDPGIYISRNNDVEVDPSTLSGRIFANLANEKTVEELKASLADLTRRQIMTTLNGMLKRDEINYLNHLQDELTLSPDTCNSILANIQSKKASQIIHHPVNIGVFCTSPQLAKKFIGTLCNTNIAGRAVISAGKRCIAVSEITQRENGYDFFDISGSILIFDKSKTEHLEQSLEFLQDVKKSNSPAFVVADLPVPEETSSPSDHLLAIKNPDNTIFTLKWSQKNCLAIIEKLFQSIICPTS